MTRPEGKTVSTFDHLAAAGDLLGIAMQIPDVTLDLTGALDEHDNDVDQAAADSELLRVWTGAAGETRAALLLNLAWASREHPISTPDDAAGLYADDLHRYAADFAGDSEAFHGAAFPAMPLPGQAGALASSVGFDRDDVAISLKAVLILLAPVRAAGGQ